MQVLSSSVLLIIVRILYEINCKCFLPTGVISDLDTDSKASDNKSWISYFKKGYLLWNPTFDQISIVWDASKPIVLKSGYGLNGRGMELSELVVFDGKLLTLDDRTGIIYVIENNVVIPWVILMDGNGQSAKGKKVFI